MVSPKVKTILGNADRYFTRQGITPRMHKWRNMVLRQADKFLLFESEVKDLAKALNITFKSPVGIPGSWIISICKKFMSVKYTNPKDKNEFIVALDSNSVFGIDGVLHHTPNGWKNPEWFNTFVTDLDLMFADYQNDITKIPSSLSLKKRENFERFSFRKNVNDPINQAFSTKGMKIEQIRAINAFFGKYIPDIDGICNNCFKLCLPESGPGIRWRSTSLSECEIRLSEPKKYGRIGQQKLYITHLYVLNTKRLVVKWDGLRTSMPSLDSNVGQELTHLCWKTYDYEYITNSLSNFQVPICQCLK